MEHRFGNHRFRASLSLSPPRDSPQKQRRGSEARALPQRLNALEVSAPTASEAVRFGEHWRRLMLGRPEEASGWPLSRGWLRTKEEGAGPKDRARGAICATQGAGPKDRAGSDARDEREPDPRTERAVRPREPGPRTGTQRFARVCDGGRHGEPAGAVEEQRSCAPDARVPHAGLRPSLGP